jgi:2-polyprenyl-6-hydroxyphenyl methylase/3-demethylubiquinone-9 3-methyltransferase
MKISGYNYNDSRQSHMHPVLLPKVCQLLAHYRNAPRGGGRVFELGCGNGSVAHVLAEHGFEVIGVDPSKEGIEQARKCYPSLKLYEYD